MMEKYMKRQIEAALRDSPDGALNAAYEAGIKVEVEHRDGKAWLRLKSDNEFPEDVIAGLRKHKPGVIALIVEADRQLATDYPEAHAILEQQRHRERQRKAAEVDPITPAIRWRLTWFAVLHVLDQAQGHGITVRLDRGGQLRVKHHGAPPAILRQICNLHQEIVAFLTMQSADAERRVLPTHQTN